MRVVLQRVKEASVRVQTNKIAEIGYGLVLFLGIAPQDTIEQVQWLARKISKLRIFDDQNGKMNLSLQEVKGEILLISQFTLYANCKRGRRPDFIAAAKPDFAKKMYLHFAESLQLLNHNVKLGKFGAHMDIQLINDGPVTLVLER